MNGKIKWFSAEKGKGYIYGSDGNEYYFNVKGVKGSELPRNGDEVEFERREGKTGPIAHNVVIVKSFKDNQVNARESEKDKSSVVCPKCGKRMVPRLVFKDGEVQRSVCPFCMATYKNNGCLGVFGAVFFALSLAGAGLFKLMT